METLTRKGRNSQASQDRPARRRAELVETLARVHSMSERDTETKAETPERPGKVGDGIAENTVAARQADTACDEHAKDRIPVTGESPIA